MTQPPDRPQKRLYGRRKGKPLRRGHASLMDSLFPQLKIELTNEGAGSLDVAALFGNANPVHLEIGFGGAEHLLDEARQNPDINFIGVEPFENGMAKAVAGIDELGLPNVRLFMDDGRLLLDALPDACIERIWILYPDPWHKKKHWKRRFVRPDNIVQLARVLQPGCELRFASDITTYVDWTLQHMIANPHFVWTAQCADDWRTPWQGWQSTRYEQKAIREGRKGHYLTFDRVS